MASGYWWTMLRLSAGDYRGEYERTKHFYLTGLSNDFYLILALEYEVLAAGIPWWER